MNENNTLSHYGVLGMKWGVRKDRLKANAGRVKARKERKKAREERAEERREQQTENAVRAKSQRDAERSKRHDLHKRGTLTDAELRQKIERLKMEKELRELTMSELAPGKAFVNQVLKDSGKKAVTTALTGAMLYGAKAAADKSFDRKEFGSAVFNGGAKKK